MQLYIFLDTMVFLHFRPLDELNLQKVVSAPSLTVVVPRITIRELDKHKSTHPQKRIRARAKRVLQDLEMALESGSPLKGRIAVEYFPEFPDKQLSRLNLNPEWGDDVLIASVIAYQEKIPERAVALISQDSGPRFTCKYHGIASFQIDAALQLPDEPDEAEKELRDLRQQNQRLQATRPRIDLGFRAENSLTKHQRFLIGEPFRIDEEKLSAKLREVKEANPKLSPPQRPPVRIGFQELCQESLLNPLTPERVSKYNSRLDHFYYEMESYLRAIIQHADQCRFIVEFQLEIHNSGTVPADDVDLNIKFQPGVKVSLEGPKPLDMKQPEPPEPPKTTVDFSSSALHKILNESSLSKLQRLPSGISPYGPTLSVTKDCCAYLRQHFDRVKHGLPKSVTKLYFHLPPNGSIRHFECQYELHAANIAEPVSGVLRFVIDGI